MKQFNMRNILLLSFTALGLIVIWAFKTQQAYPKDILIEPADLAKILKDPNAKQPVIINMGSTPMIKNAVSGGMGYSDEAMKELKRIAPGLDKNSMVVVYCGCCKLGNCPNVKLPYEYLKSLGFKNVKILNMETDIQADWIGKGYPMKGTK